MAISPSTYIHTAACTTQLAERAPTENIARCPPGVSHQLQERNTKAACRRERAGLCTTCTCHTVSSRKKSRQPGEGEETAPKYRIIKRIKIQFPPPVKMGVQRLCLVAPGMVVGMSSAQPNDFRLTFRLDYIHHKDHSSEHPLRRRRLCSEERIKHVRGTTHLGFVNGAPVAICRARRAGGRWWKGDEPPGGRNVDFLVFPHVDPW